jgi:hypothetical protein
MFHVSRIRNEFSQKKIAHELLHIFLSALNNYRIAEEILKEYDTGIGLSFF